MKKFFAIILFAVLFNPAFAQIEENMYQTDHMLKSENTGNLTFELDNLSFFKNNEWKGNFAKGYTLPGIWLQPKFTYQPLNNIKLEVGAHGLFYWGAGETAHVRPFIRAQVELLKGFNVVMGSIYGASNHKYNNALYNTELNLTADPQMGIQLLYDSERFSADGWVDWNNYIFPGDDEQEIFYAGISTKGWVTKKDSKFQMNIPIQVVFRHQGGEIDSVRAGIQTWLNAGTGISGSYQVSDTKFFRKISAEVMGFYFKQCAGEVLPVETGYGVNAWVAAEMKMLQVKAGYWWGKDFVSILGSPFFSCVSSCDPGFVYQSPSMLYAHVEFNKNFGKICSIGAEVDAFYHLSSKGNYIYSSALPEPQKSACSIAFGVYIRLNPSFLLKKFK